MNHTFFIFLCAFIVALSSFPSKASSSLDVNGDSKADILWRNNITGQNWLWTMDGLTVSKSQGLNTIPLEWEIVGRGDFDGDAKSDILWRNSKSGRNYIYLMDGFVIREAKELNYIADTDWKIKAVIDLNGDGKDDIVWRHQKSGRTWVYLINGIAIDKSTGSQTVADLNWTIVGSGDVNGDGKGDIIWRHLQTGLNYIWLMNGSSIQGQYALNKVSSLWNIVGIGDLDGDNTDDVIWRNSSTGMNWAYLMKNGQIEVSKQINTIADNEWHIRTIGDLNDDGKTDVFWRHQGTGKTYAYLMNGTSISKAGYSSTINLDWQVISDSVVPVKELSIDQCTNNSSTSCVLALNDSIDGTLELNDDGDVFIIDVAESGMLTVFSSGSTDVNGGLFEAGNGNSLLLDDNSGEGNNFLLSYQVEPKRYYIQVKGNTGAYTLTSQFEAQITANDYYQENVSTQIVQSKCVLCHTASGAAASTRLHFVAANVENYQQINQQRIQEFLAIEGVESTYLITKGQGGLTHGGGAQIVFGSAEYEALSDYIQILLGGGDSQVDADFWQGVGISNNKETLRRAALLLAGRLPTNSEYSSVSDNKEGSLRIAVKNLLQGDEFHQFLIEGANDQLLTDKYFSSFSSFIDSSDTYFPTWVNFNYNTREQGNHAEAERFISQMNFGYIRSPVELIAYIIENEKPYSEILTADYNMINPALNFAYQSGLEFENEDDPTEFKPGKIKDYRLWDDSVDWEYSFEFGTKVHNAGPKVDWPHAGILNTPVFLHRYPTTATNRNRARSRWTQYFFLDFDIEKSASRTADPDAIADKNNPTMNNPNCTVCHIPMDPVAGAFQNYNDVGHYRGQYGGMDALADSYKWPENGDSLYQEGDTWYRGMRLPGFNNEIAPDNANSLQWLAQKIVQDPRFYRASVKFWWPALFGAKSVIAPEEQSDIDFDAKLALYQQQSAAINNWAELLAETGNIKDVFVEMVMSNWFRAQTTSSIIVKQQEQLKAVGLGKLLTPEQLDRKTRALIGMNWKEENVNYRLGDGHTGTALTEHFRTMYGGIDSNGVINRATDITSLMSQISMTHAIEMSCPAVMVDFNKPDGERLLFNELNRTLTPNTISENLYTVNGFTEQEADYNSSTIEGLEVGNKTLTLNYINDRWENGVDLNLILQEVKLTNILSQESVVMLEGAQLSDYLTSDDCGGETNWNDQEQRNVDLMMWSNCSAKIPIDIVKAGTYKVEVKAYYDVHDENGRVSEEVARAFGPAQLLANIDLDNPYDTGKGNRTIKEKLVELHFKMLGESLTIDSEEIQFTYKLLVESWQGKLLRNNGVEIGDGVTENCHYWTPEIDNIEGWSSDPVGMLTAWRTVIAYLMSDPLYIHE